MQNVNYKLVRKTTSSLLAAVTASMLLAGCSGGGSTAGQSSVQNLPYLEVLLRVLFEMASFPHTALRM